MPGLLSFSVLESVCRESYQLLPLTSQRRQRGRRALSRSVPLALLFAVAAISLVGCSSNGMTVVPPPPPGPTSVTLLRSSTANDRLLLFSMAVTGITLTSESGNAVTLFSGPQNGQFMEFMHLNGTFEPLVTVSVPQGTYVSAAVTVMFCDFTNLSVGPTGGLVSATYAQGLCGNGTGTASVNLPSPIQITGTAMGLKLDLETSQSFSLTSVGPPAVYTITPVFNLTPVSFSSQSANQKNTELHGLDGRIASINPAAKSFGITTPDGSALSINSDGSTAFQGIDNLSALTVGMFADMDMAIQMDGSLLASRITVEDPSARDVTMGPIAGVYGQSTLLYTSQVQQQGVDTPLPITWQFQYTGNTIFKTSIQSTNLQSLPFTPVFDASSMVAGQNVYLSSSFISTRGGVNSLASTITLVPQTINGTVLSASNSGGFQTYTVGLAPYNLLPTLTAEVGQSIILNAANTVVVYVNSSTRMFHSSPIAVGSLLRFNGLLFNDNGTLRMGCVRVNDGVTE